MRDSMRSFTVWFRKSEDEDLHNFEFESGY